MDKKRLEVATGAVGISNSFIDMDFAKGQSLNIHGLRVMVSLEPQDADANANGIIGVWFLPGGVIQNSSLPNTYGQYGDEDHAPYLWGYAPWTASNQTPFNFEFAPKTSRNMQAGGRIVVSIRVEGISAGLVRQNTTITCFTSALS